MSPMQMWKDDAGIFRPLFSPDPNDGGKLKLAQSPECCCKEDAQCCITDTFHPNPECCQWVPPAPDCPETYLGCFNQMGCIDFSQAPAGTLSDPCQVLAYLQTRPLDMILPDGWTGDACIVQGSSCNCEDMNNAAITMQIQPSTFGLFSGLRWKYDDLVDTGSGWCGPFTDGCIRRTCEIFIECQVWDFTTPKIYACRLRAKLGFQWTRIPPGDFSYTYQKWFGLNSVGNPVGNVAKIRLEDFDETIPLTDPPIPFDPGSPCYNPAIETSIRIKSH